MRNILICLLLLFAPSAIAAPPAPLQNNQVWKSSEVLATTAINTNCQADPTTVATASLTCAAFELDMRGYIKVWLIVEYTFSSASVVHIAQDGATDRNGDGTPDLPWAIYNIPTAGTGGAVALDDESGNKPVTASTAFLVEYDINAPFIRWRFTSTGGAVGDTVRVYLVQRGP